MTRYSLVSRDGGAIRTLSVYVFFILVLALFSVQLAVPASSAAQTEMIPASFADVAQKASPAVVNISTVKVIKARPNGRTFQFGGPNQPNQPSNPNDPFQQFFERFFGDQMPQRDRKERSLGSGFIIDPKGFIITNNHVIEGADEVIVRLSDEHEFQAKVIGRDPKTDVALIKITSDVDLPYLELGDSSTLRVGDWVVAIGNPFGLEHTVTAGILSARGRAIGAGPYDDFLQTDASINPGNSGGPLLNLNGEVIGINSAIIAGGQGIGFAIPANMAKGIVSQLKETGRVVRGWLGVMIQKITPELAKSFDLASESGALVADVTAGSPAEKAGLKRGDVIVSFNGKPVNEWSDLPTMVANTDVGSDATVTIFRDGKEKDLKLTIAELKEEQEAAANVEEGTDLGITVQELTPELASRLGLDKASGVVVTGLADGSPAAESGLQPGDLILEINRQPVETVADYQAVIGKAKAGETLLFLIRRGSNTLFFTINNE